MQDREKLQGERIATAEDFGEGIIVSPDTRRAQRLPPNQARTKKWPVLDANGPPKIDLSSWRLGVSGLVQTDLTFAWREFRALPRVKVFADMHCVTRWSRLGNVWEGVSTGEILRRAGALPEARFVVVHDTTTVSPRTCHSRLSHRKTLSWRIATTGSRSPSSTADPFV